MLTSSRTNTQSILVVDDARFSSALIAKRLNQAGYDDVRTANSAKDALVSLKEQVADVLIADWLMPEMDGIELCREVRKLDTRKQRFTACLIVTGKDSSEALNDAFEQGVDDFIVKSDITHQLLPRVKAAMRNSQRQNQLLVNNAELKSAYYSALSAQLRDPETGVGNVVHASETLNKILEHTDSRGGATSYMLIKIKNWDELSANVKPHSLTEFSRALSKKLKSMVRPLDEVCRIADDQYVVIAHFSDSAHCTTGPYKRIHTGLNLQSFKTPSGFLSASISTAICFVDNNAKNTSFDQLHNFSERLLEESAQQDKLVLAPFQNVG